MITLGIDLSSQPKQSAACEILWSGGAAVVRPPVHPLSDDQIVEAVQRADVAGVDVPLGWPAPLIDAAQKRGAGTAWPDRPSADLLFRATDAWVRRFTEQQPLSVAADRIGWSAVRAARLVARLAEAGTPVDRSGASGRLVEVYPAAALRRWASQWSKYKGVANIASLDASATEVLTRPWLRFADDARDRYWRLMTASTR